MASKNKSLVEEHKFWHYIDTRKQEGCWKWLGNVRKDGLAQMGVTNFTRRMGTRYPWVISWILLNGSKPTGELKRWCRTKNCCNPNHREEQ